MAKKSIKIPIENCSAERFTLADMLGVERAQTVEPATEPVTPKAEVLSMPHQPDITRAPLRIALERKGRAGKTVTKLSGLSCSDSAQQFFLKELKRQLGCGAQIEDACLVFQGDQHERLAALLQSKGARNVKISGA